MLALAAKNMARGSVGRGWMAVRDMDVAAEVIGTVAAAHQAAGLCDQLLLLRRRAARCLPSPIFGTVEPAAFTLDLSFRILFMVIIGGLGTIMGSFLGAGFILLLPIFLNVFFHSVFGQVGRCQRSTSALEQVIFGVMIIAFLIYEPLGLARLWQLTKERLRLWPFKH